MATFGTSLSFTLLQEGGLQNLAWDKGNQQPDGSLSHTNRGITLTTLKAWRSSQGRPTATDADIVALSLEETGQIYNWLCWTPLSASQIAYQPLATVAFDAAVLCGTETSAKMVQQVAAGLGQPLLADGKLGPKSIAAINQVPGAQLAHMLVDRHSDRFADLVLGNASLAPGLPIWRTRRSRWRALILAG